MAQGLFFLIDCFWTSGQDGGMDKHALPPHTTTEKITIRPQNK